jgi:hypothetical protein
MRAAYDEILEDGIRRQLPMPQVVGALLRAQIAYQLGMAKFPMAKTLAQFDFGASPVNEKLVRERHAAGFWMTNAIWSWSAAPAKRIWRWRSAATACASAGVPGFTTRSIWGTGWMRNPAPAARINVPPA